MHIERARTGCHRARQFVAGPVQCGRDLLEPRPRGWLVHRSSECSALRAVESMRTRANADHRGADADEEPRDRAFPLSVPEPEIEVVIVRALVPAEPDVAVDAEDGAQDTRFGVGLRREPVQLLAYRHDEPSRRLQVPALVVVAMRLEPGPVVVIGEISQVVEGGLRKAGEGGPGGQAVPSMVGASATFSVTLYSRYMPTMSRVCASSAGSTLKINPTTG
jgi:hypothetical protein